jgi:transcriptional regulator
MYIPAHFAAHDGLLESLLAAGAIADLVTFGPDGFDSTPLPLLVVDGALHGHVARNNSQWQVGLSADGAPALAIVRGPDAYVSPGWYESTREHGRVVPTWNYEVVHVHGRLVAHDDPVWTERLVRRLTQRYEAGLPAPWSVDDAPPEFIAGQLRAIVGIELVIERIEAKAKLSQNRPAADVSGVIAALRAGNPRQQAVGEAVRDARRARPDRPDQLPPDQA